MRLRVIPKNELASAQQSEAARRIYAPEHSMDLGPRYFWNRPEHDRHHFALFDLETDEFVGTVRCVITTPIAQDFTWWFDSRVRGKGYWRALADDLAGFLKRRHKIEKIGFISFGGNHPEASQKIAQRLREHFDMAGTSPPKK